MPAETLVFGYGTNNIDQKREAEMHLGMDIGGTKMETVLLDSTGDVRWRQRVATPKSSVEQFVQGVIAEVERAQREAGTTLSMGFCLPGAIEPHSCLVKNSNIQVVNGYPLHDILSEYFGQPLAVANDANCFALSEATDGSGAGHNVVFGAILGTGCGGGIVANQRLMTGPNACSGEWGHNPLPHYRPEYDGESPLCYCGQYHCLESFISGSGLARQFRQQAAQEVTAEDLVQQMREGREGAQALWRRYRNQVARAFASVVNLLDPDVIVVGGGLSGVDELYSGLSEEMAQYVFGGRCVTPVVPATHGASSGVRGAAWAGEQALQNGKTRGIAPER